jgi:hypothetical protein
MAGSMKRRRIVQITFVLVPASLALAWAAHVVDFRCRHIIQGEPLKSPIKVVRVDGHRFVLEDGRTMESKSLRPGTLSDMLSQSGFQVDLGPCRDGTYHVWARQRGGISNTRWRPAWRIPLFKRTVYVNGRKHIGSAKEVDEPPETQRDAPS